MTALEAQLARYEGEGAHADTEWVSQTGTSTAAVLTQLAQDFCA